ncbi:MAG TPA: glycosyltransferase family 1 protein [Candidatus Saccharimonadales bacterium]|nr:glycosyltransferase family 1 protein [Candidatus Saccharimonadales bacterium]
MSEVIDLQHAALGTATGKHVPRIGVVCDLLQEYWPSMNLVADMLLQRFQEDYSSRLQAERLRPSYQRHFTQFVHGPLKAVNDAERALNRYVKYPHWLSQWQRHFDLFHIVDHSYAHLIHHLPPERTVVYCHDLEAFRCLTQPDHGLHSRLLRRITMRILDGLKRAAWITCNSSATANELLARGWVRPDRVSVAHYGVAPVFSAEASPAADAAAEQLLGPRPDAVKILHVGSTIPRKRISVLLRVFAEIRKAVPTAVLVRVGGPLTHDQQVLAKQLRVDRYILELPFLTDRLLAAVYRKSTLFLFPSEREGFGMPVLEAMACGLPVIASDIPPVREVAREAARYCGVDDIQAFGRQALEIVEANKTRSAGLQQQRRAGFMQARRFTWTKCADQTAEVYEKVLAEHQSAT